MTDEDLKVALRVLKKLGLKDAGRAVAEKLAEQQRAQEEQDRRQKLKDEEYESLLAYWTRWLVASEGR